MTETPTEPAWKKFLSLKNEAKQEPPELSPKLQEARILPSALKTKRATATDATDPPAKRMGKRQRTFLATQQESAKRTQQATRQRSAAQHQTAHRKREEAERRAALAATRAYLDLFVAQRTGVSFVNDERKTVKADAVVAGKEEVVSERKRLKLAKKAQKAARRAETAEASPSQDLPGWKFSKQRQNHLLRQLYQVEGEALFPEDETGAMRFKEQGILYLREMQGASRERVLEEAQGLVKRYEAQQQEQEQKQEAEEEPTEEASKVEGEKEKDEEKAISETVYDRAQQIVSALDTEPVSKDE
ncbi:hypothetical protein BCR37DRAFT_392035 [Protomyces lactucae-debilis]|uniref:WKF domain-containing protein n=1 Tax=Protomyces lactucae-debilis TaxID=2754530 RepID=A0A1Y2FKE9_PROLT|nr:uncharacterized protein BCR37DRAFT_392035 [Protomyces lactucae-debilis]ORY84461.1 hypothetical protein BCR37DRAFT_392035 [Protomyces lactucae-debilis]